MNEDDFDGFGRVFACLLPRQDWCHQLMPGHLHKHVQSHLLETAPFCGDWRCDEQSRGEAEKDVEGRVRVVKVLGLSEL